MYDKSRGYDLILRALQANDVRIAMVDGPRGVGKTTFVSGLLARTNAVAYKTWGKNQKTEREIIGGFGLCLPQGTYFVLDFLSQVRVPRLVVCDRSVLSSLAYQRSTYGNNYDLHKYYTALMEKSKASIVYLSAPADKIVERRVRRGLADEDAICCKSLIYREQAVKQDILRFDEAIGRLLHAGLSFKGAYAVLENQYAIYSVQDKWIIPEDTSDAGGRV